MILYLLHDVSPRASLDDPWANCLAHTTCVREPGRPCSPLLFGSHHAHVHGPVSLQMINTVTTHVLMLAAVAADMSPGLLELSSGVYVSPPPNRLS